MGIPSALQMAIYAGIDGQFAPLSTLDTCFSEIPPAAAAVPSASTGAADDDARFHGPASGVHQAPTPTFRHWHGCLIIPSLFPVKLEKSLTLLLFRTPIPAPCLVLFPKGAPIRITGSGVIVIPT